jgi:hypothetical protein
MCSFTILSREVRGVSESKATRTSLSQLSLMIQSSGIFGHVPGPLDSEDEVTTIFLNIDSFLPSDTM